MMTDRIVKRYIYDIVMTGCPQRIQSYPIMRGVSDRNVFIPGPCLYHATADHRKENGPVYFPSFRRFLHLEAPRDLLKPVHCKKTNNTLVECIQNIPAMSMNFLNVTARGENVENICVCVCLPAQRSKEFVHSIFHIYKSSLTPGNYDE